MKRILRSRMTGGGQKECYFGVALPLLVIRPNFCVSGLCELKRANVSGKGSTGFYCERKEVWRGSSSIQRGIKYTINLAALIAIVLNVTCAIAGDEGITRGSVLKFCAGIVAAYATHEGSHALVAGVTGTDLDWEIGTYNQPVGFTENADSDSKGVAVHSAGLIGQAIESEIILQADKIDKNDAFVRGMMAWNIVNPIIYALDYWFIRVSNQKNGNSYQGDIEGVEHYSNESTANGFALSMVAIAAFQGYRFLKTQSWAPDWVKGEKHTVNLAPLPSGGVLMTYKFAF